MSDDDDSRRSYDLKIAVLSERVENWMVTTTEYRKALCAKIDVLSAKIGDLPCAGRVEETKAIRGNVAWLQKIVYGVLAVGAPSLLALAVAWGALNNDVSHLKNTSYGYRGIKVVTDGSGGKL